MVWGPATVPSNSASFAEGGAGILAGHGRLLAARKLGLAEVPVVVLDHLSETQRRAYIIADNKLAMNTGWEEKMLASELRELEKDGMDLAVAGFSGEELEALLEDGAQPPEDVADEVTEPPVQPVTQSGDVWLIVGSIGIHGARGCPCIKWGLDSSWTPQARNLAGQGP